MALSTLRFSTFNVANQVFFQSSSRLSFALVNLKPIVPGRAFFPLAVPPSRAKAPCGAHAQPRSLRSLMRSWTRRCARRTDARRASTPGLDAGRGVGLVPERPSDQPGHRSRIQGTVRLPFRPEISFRKMLTVRFSSQSAQYCAPGWSHGRSIGSSCVPSSPSLLFERRLTEYLLPPDVHVHIIPRRAKDFEPLDESESARHCESVFGRSWSVKTDRTTADVLRGRVSHSVQCARCQESLPRFCRSLCGATTPRRAESVRSRAARAPTRERRIAVRRDRRPRTETAQWRRDADRGRAVEQPVSGGEPRSATAAGSGQLVDPLLSLRAHGLRAGLDTCRHPIDSLKKSS